MPCEAEQPKATIFCSVRGPINLVSQRPALATYIDFQSPPCAGFFVFAGSQFVLHGARFCGCGAYAWFIAFRLSDVSRKPSLI